MKTTINAVTYTATKLAANRFSVSASGAGVEALLAGVLAWPTDAQVSSLVGERVRLVDGAESATEAIYTAAE